MPPQKQQNKTAKSAQGKNSQPKIEKREEAHIEKETEKDLRFAFLVTIGAFSIQMLGYYFSNSLALLSDSAHVFSDMLSLAVSLLAFRMALRAHSTRTTFGFHRVEVFAAGFNAVLLILMSAFILLEALERISHPVEINSIPMLVTAFIGLCANVFVVSRLEKNENLNVRSAFLHAAGDALSSVGAIISGIIIAFTGITVVDSLVSFLIVAILCVSAYRLLATALSIFFETAPHTATPEMVTTEIRRFPGVLDVHDVHVWSICSDVHYATAHIVVENENLAETKELIDSINKRLKIELSIAHTTFQLENAICEGTICYTWHSKHHRD